MTVIARTLSEAEALIEQQERHLQSYSRANAKLHADWLTMEAERDQARAQLAGAVNLDDEAVIECATRALCDEEWWEEDWMTAMNVVGIAFQAAKGGQ
jgi:hypothetical protein